MGDILNTAQRIQETQTEILRLESLLVHHKDDPTIALTLNSLHKRQKTLEDRFAGVAHTEYLDVCTYKLITEKGSRPTILTLAQTLVDFQRLFTTAFDAIKTGPKKRARIQPDTVAASAFEFGYSFAGSVGIVLTIPNERLLIGGSEMDQAIEIIFKLTKTTDSNDIAAYARETGLATIRQLYKWASNHVNAGVDAEIKWRREKNIRAEVLVQVPELERLLQMIERTNEEYQESVTIAGTLVGADTKTHNFHMEFADGNEIRGKMAENIGHDQTVNLPKHYNATFLKTSKIHYATEKDDISYYLQSLN